MQKLLKTLVLAAGLTALQAGLAYADLKIGFAAEPFPPFSSKDASGKWVGWEVDAIDAVCKAMNEKCDYVEVAWDGIIPALQAKYCERPSAAAICLLLCASSDTSAMPRR